jgi:hypothetical protein
MNSHKNARLTLEGRKLLVERIAGLGLIPAARRQASARAPRVSGSSASRGAACRACTIAARAR